MIFMNFSKCHTFTLTHTVMDCYLSSFHSARENANLIMMIFFLLRDNVCVCVCVCVCVVCVCVCVCVFRPVCLDFQSRKKIHLYGNYL